MGGWGSGRHWSSRDTTNDYMRIDVRYMQRKGMLRVNASGSLWWSRRGERVGAIAYSTEADHVMLSYKHQKRGADWESLKYPVALEWMPCNYGGQRAWFLCPARGCGRRVATLFGGRIYACRRCYGLAYPSQRQSLSDRASDRAERILKRLGWDDFLTIFDPAPERPKGMHEHTYKKLAAEYERARFEAFAYGPPGVLALYEP